MKITLLYRTYLLIIAILFQSIVLMAGTLQGTVKDMNGKDIPFASISIKKTTKGTTANSKGQYVLQISKGEYIGKGGNTGNSRGSHLHLVASYKGEYIHPEYLFDFYLF